MYATYQTTDNKTFTNLQKAIAHEFHYLFPITFKKKPELNTTYVYHINNGDDIDKGCIKRWLELFSMLKGEQPNYSPLANGLPLTFSIELGVLVNDEIVLFNQVKLETGYVSTLESDGFIAPSIIYGNSYS